LQSNGKRNSPVKLQRGTETGVPALAPHCDHFCLCCQTAYMSAFTKEAADDASQYWFELRVLVEPFLVSGEPAERIASEIIARYYHLDEKFWPCIPYLRRNWAATLSEHFDYRPAVAQ
jgi:hypothetical protein